MIRSFRLRIAVLSAALSGLVLIIFGVSSWWLIRQVEIERMDSTLRAQIEREIAAGLGATPWPEREARLRERLNINDSKNLVLLAQLVLSDSSTPIYRSAHWPTLLQDQQWPWPIAQDNNAQAPQQDHGWRGNNRPPPPFGAPPGFEAGLPPLAYDIPSRGGVNPAPLPVMNTVIHSVRNDGQYWRIGLASLPHGRLAIAVNIGALLDESMKDIRRAFLAALPLALLFIGLSSWLFSRRALQPLQKLNLTARNVNAAGLDQRISVQGEDREFVELIEVLNQMLARLQRSFEQAYRFSADASHELRTPLAILQGQLERAINQAVDGSTEQEALSNILDEVRHLSTISRKLLLLSQADAGRLNVYREDFDLSAALEDLIEDTRMLAPHLQVSGIIEPKLTISVDSSLLRQVLHNLISNAIKYNEPDGWIHLLAQQSTEGVEIQVSNTTTGIAPNDRELIFERFYRADPSHSKHIEGVGLGLSVAREIARAHGGDLILQDVRASSVTFSLRLPMR